MSRKGNCLDNRATEQVFGHMGDESFRGRNTQLIAPFILWELRRRDQIEQIHRRARERPRQADHSVRRRF